MKLPSASALQRAFACPESFALPQVEEVASVYAESGTTIHEMLRRIGKGESKEDILRDIPEDDPGRQACEDIDTDKVPRSGHHELALAWDPETGIGRMLGENIGRQYEKLGVDRSRELCGSVDYGGVLADRRVLVLDYKSGWQLIPARESWQLKFLSVAQADAAGADEAIAGHLVLRGTSVRWDVVEWDALALAGFRAELRQLVSDLQAMKSIEDLEHANVVEGVHCKYCPAHQRCPAKVGLVRHLVQLTMGPARVDAMTVSEMAQAWRKLDAYDAVAKRLRAEIEKQAELAPLDLEDGYELRVAPGSPKDKVINPSQAIALLRTHFGEQTALEAVGTSKASIVGAAKSWARRTGTNLKAAEERALALMRSEGVIEKTSAESAVREVRKGR